MKLQVSSIAIGGTERISFPRIKFWRTHCTLFLCDGSSMPYALQGKTRAELAGEVQRKQEAIAAGATYVERGAEGQLLYCTEQYVIGAGGLVPVPLAERDDVADIVRGESPQPKPARLIIAAHIGPMPKGLFDAMPTVTVEYNDGTQEKLFEFYPDEISFAPGEFHGLTREQALQLRHRKDVTFLQS